MIKLALVIILFLASPAFAQQQQQTIDPRTAPQAINVLQAMLALREAELKAVREDAAKREADWAAYSAPLWKDEVKTGEAK